MMGYHELPSLLISYFDGIGELDAVRECVNHYAGEVDDQLLNQVSLEIWHFEDGLIGEDELRSRLAVSLTESRETSMVAPE